MEEVLRYVRQKQSDLSEMEERLRTGGTSRELRSLVRLGEEQLGRLRRELRLLGQGADAHKRDFEERIQSGTWYYHVMVRSLFSRLFFCTILFILQWC